MGTRLDPIRSMAKIHQTPATTICSPSSIEGSSINQPVHSNFGQTNRHPIVQIGRQVRSRKKNDLLPELKHELPDNQIPQASDQPLWPAVSTKSSTLSNENKPSLSLSLTMLIQSKLLSTFQLCAERWPFLTASSKVKPDSDNSSAENNAPVLLSLKSKTSINKNSLNSSKP